MKQKIKHKQPKETTKLPIANAKAFIEPKYLVALVALLAITCVAYFPALKNGFVWDDIIYIEDNQLIRTINFKEIFSQYVLGNYHPITILILAIEFHFFGLSPSGYHTVNLLVHIINVALVFYFIFRLSSKNEVAFVVALLFSVHPIHVESVAWVSELKDLLYTLFFLASLISYLKFKSSNQKKFYVFSLILFLISLLSKAMAASLPVVFILIDYLSSKRINLKNIVDKIPFFILAIIFGVVAIFAQQSTNALQDFTYFTFPVRIVFACYSIITYIINLLLPIKLCAYYPYPLINVAGIPGYYYLYLFLFIGLAVAVYYSLRFSKKIFFGIGFFAATVFLVLQLLPVGGAIMADRYMYIPSIGIFYLIGEGLFALWNKKNSASTYKIILVLLLSIMFIFFGLKTYSQCSIWKDGMTLWNDVIKKDQTVPSAYVNRGLLLTDQKKYNDALDDYNKALELNPNYSDAYLNRGALFTETNKNNEALSDFNKSIELNPNNVKAYANRGKILMLKGQFNDALNDCNKALELKPDYAIVYNTRGNVLMNTSKFDDALKDFNHSLELKSDNAETYMNRGILFRNEGKQTEAFNDFNKAILLTPTLAEAYYNRGFLYLDQKNNVNAMSDFTSAIKLKPDFVEAIVNRANIFMAEQKFDEALNDYNLAVKVRPDFAKGYFNRGILLSSQKKYSFAINDFTKAIGLMPDYDKAYYNRGLAKSNSGNKEGACIDFQDAIKLGFKPATDLFNKLCH